MTGQRQSCCLFEDPFATHNAIERNHDGLVGGACNGSGWDLLVLWRVQEEQGGRSRCEDISSHASQEQSPGSVAAMGRKRNQLRVSVLLRIRVNSNPSKSALHVLRLHVNTLRL